MNYAISNIAWSAENDKRVYELMGKFSFLGLEIAPTRIFPEQPYNHLQEAKRWSKEIYEEYGITIPSMQSIWYGRKERIFGDSAERLILFEYTKRAIDFAKIIGCHNLVFGCPQNRRIMEKDNELIAVEFFNMIGEYAFSQNTAIGMEANPTIYGTNYINTTFSALELIKKVDSRGFKLTLDLGTIIQNNEDLNSLREIDTKINHVHISEPGLKPIVYHHVLDRLKMLLSDCDYDKYVSIEMGRVDSIENIRYAMQMVREKFELESK